MAKLSSKAIGSIVKLNVNGAATEFFVVHQGKPSSMYDDSCNGTWVLMKDCYTSMAWDSSSNDYANSDVHTYLNGTFFGLLDSDIKSNVKTVKLPYINGTGPGGFLATGSSGISSHVFLLSYTEVGFSGDPSVNVDGAVLSYFDGVPNSKRIAYHDGTAAEWWLRTPYYRCDCCVWDVECSGGPLDTHISYLFGIRPAMILDPELFVSDDGTVSTNTAPTVTSTSGASGVNLGTKSAGFNLSYTVADEDGDSLTITEKLDGVTKKTFTSTGGTYTFDAVKTANFFKVLNGTHTLTVEVNDGKDTATFTATFTKSVTSASITLENALAVAGDITAAVLAVTGSIPDDATYTVEVTNNANDSSPVWQNVTSEVKNGSNIVFTNSVCTNGAAFNFRISVSRGASGEGGHISAVSGAFQ